MADAAQHDAHAVAVQLANEREVARDVIGADGVLSAFLAHGAAMDRGALLLFHGARELRQLDGVLLDELALQPLALLFPSARAPLA